MYLCFITSKWLPLPVPPRRSVVQSHACYYYNKRDGGDTGNRTQTFSLRMKCFPIKLYPQGAPEDARQTHNLVSAWDSNPVLYPHNSEDWDSRNSTWAINFKFHPIASKIWSIWVAHRLNQSQLTPLQIQAHRLSDCRKTCFVFAANTTETGGHRRVTLPFITACKAGTSLFCHWPNGIVFPRFSLAAYLPCGCLC